MDMRQRTYTCKQFQVDQLPCLDAMAVCNRQKISPYNYCSKYYTKEELYATYEAVVHLIGSREGWDVSEEVRNQVIIPTQSVDQEDLGLLGFYPKVKAQRQLGAADIILMDITGKPIPIQFHFAQANQQGRKNHLQ